MKSNDNLSQNRGVLKPLGLASSVAFAYAILFVALSLVTNKNIDMDTLVLPAIALFLLVSSIEYGFSRKNKSTPQPLLVGSFIIALIIAFVMTFVV